MSDELKASPLAQTKAVDPHSVPVQFVDWIVTHGVGPAPGIVNIDLAALDFALDGGDQPPQAILQSRLRFSVATAKDIVRALQAAIDALTTPPGSSVN